MANRRKTSKTNHENQQLLMMALLQHQKLINTFFLKIILLSSSQKTMLRSFLKIILLSSCQKTMLRSFFKHPMFHRVFLISFPNVLFVLQNFNIQFQNYKSFLVIRIDHIWLNSHFNLIRSDLNSLYEQPTELSDELRIKHYLDSYIALMSHLINKLKIFLF